MSFVDTLNGRGRTTSWRNWSRAASTNPLRVEHPESPEAVAEAITRAARQGVQIKPIGSGHSFTDIAVAPGVQLVLDRLRGVVEVDEASGRVTIAAGTRLWELPELLAPYRLALANMGDVDRQTVSGVTSTGTHGTGGSFGGLTTQIVGATLVTGDGTLLHLSEEENADLFPAVRLGLGALGVLVDLTFQCVPSYVLHSVEQPEPFSEVVDAYLERSASADHFEFFWFPHTDTALTKTNTRLPWGTPLAPLSRVGRYVNDELVANGLYRGLCALGTAVPGITPRVNRLAERLTGRRDVTDVSHRVYITSRTVRFREMEFALPRAVVPELVREIDALIKRRGWRVSFPIEVRSAAADDIWMSTAYERETGYIAIHRYYRETSPEQLSYFDEVEKLFVEAGGRPHWGKLHTQGRSYFEQVYPRLTDFLAVRDRLDPDRLFANPYLDRVLGR